MGAVRKIVDELRARGVTVHEWPGWERRGNGDVLDLDVKGIILHHTGSSYGDAYQELVESSQDWADGGALCNFAGNEDGSLTVVAAGLAYHAGGGYGPNQGPLAPYAANRNYHTVGLEIVYPGSTPMRNAQYWTAVALSRVVVDLFADGDESYVRAHAEVNGKGYQGKWDPGKGEGTEYVDMDAFRAAVRNFTPPTEEDPDVDMNTPTPVWPGPRWDGRTEVGFGEWARYVESEVGSIAEKVAELKAAGVPVKLELSAADKTELATRVADLLAARLAQ